MIGLIVIGVIAALIYIWYAIIVTRSNKALEALSGVEVQLRKRHDLIPNILAIAKRFMAHEKETLEKITELRQMAEDKSTTRDPQEAEKLFDIENQLEGLMKGLMVQVEAYPDLKSDSVMLEAQQTYREVEDNISAARRFYNASVTSLRNVTMIFPGPYIAKLAGANDMPYYEVEDSAVLNPISAEDSFANS